MLSEQDRRTGIGYMKEELVRAMGRAASLARELARETGDANKTWELTERTIHSIASNADSSGLLEPLPRKGDSTIAE